MMHSGVTLKDIGFVWVVRCTISPPTIRFRHRILLPVTDLSDFYRHLSKTKQKIERLELSFA
jgi:hypothetical protein